MGIHVWPRVEHRVIDKFQQSAGAVEVLPPACRITGSTGLPEYGLEVTPQLEYLENPSVVDGLQTFHPVPATQAVVQTAVCILDAHGECRVDGPPLRLQWGQTALIHALLNPGSMQELVLDVRLSDGLR